MKTGIVAVEICQPPRKDHTKHNTKPQAASPPAYACAPSLAAFQAVSPRPCSHPIHMNIDEKEQLARTGEVSPDAIRDRIIAARKSISMQQKDVAAEVGLKGTTFNSQETRGAPSIKTMRYYYRQRRIDFNFILHGDFAQLPQDVQERLFAALSK